MVFTDINAYRVACGKIVEGWSEPDALGLLRQLGMVVEAPPPLGTPAAEGVAVNAPVGLGARLKTLREPWLGTVSFLRAAPRPGDGQIPAANREAG